MLDLKTGSVGKNEKKDEKGYFRRMGAREYGFVGGLLLAVVIWNLNIVGLSKEGQRCLALSLMTIVWWAFNVSHSGYVSCIYLAGLVIFNVAPAHNVFELWTSGTLYLVLGAYLLAGAVKSSGLGERIAYKFIIRFVSSWRSIIVSIFGLTFILSLIIPHPWPRAFIIMSVVAVVVESASLDRSDASKLGLVVFASSVPISMIFLTGDSIINIIAVNFSGVELSWMGWLYHMGLPAAVASMLTCILILLLYRSDKEFVINKYEIMGKLNALGRMKGKESRTLAWLVFAVVLWMSDSIHGINLGWITLTIAMAMSLPVIGNIIEARDWSNVPIQVLMFLTAAIAIGRIGGVTGMNSWIASAVLPSSVPANPLVLGLVIATISIILHMFLGSVIAVMGIAIPAMLAFTKGTDMSPLVPTFFVYTSIALHYIFPFHHLNMLVGLGDENGMYTDKQVIRLGIFLTPVVFVIVILESLWWRTTGLI